MADRLSVIIPTTGRRADITRTLDAVLAAPGTTEHDVIVVVDGPEAPPPCERPVRWLWTGASKGPACARNLGATAAAGDALVFVDDDVHPDAAALGIMCRRMEAGVDAVCATVRPAPDVPDNAYVQFAYRGAAHGGEGDRREPWWHFCTSLAMVRRDVFERVGGFDERFPEAAYEDVDLAFRIHRDGSRIEVCPEAIAWHRRLMDRTWFIARGDRQGEQLVRLLAIQPDLRVRRHRHLELLGSVGVLFACGWWVGRSLLPVAERLPGALAVGFLKAVHACGLARSYSLARRHE